MKFELIKPGNDKYYNEIFFISMKYKRFIKKPNSNPISIFTSYLIRILFCIFFSLYCFICYKVFKSAFFMIFVGYFLFAAFINCIWVFKLKNQIKVIKSKNNKRTIVIDEKKIEYMDLNKTYRNSWEDIKYVLFNKHSIVFLPVSKENAIIALPISKKNDILKIIKKYKKEDIIRGNEYD